MRAYIDSDILIWHLRGKKKALHFFQTISQRGEFELWVGAMQRAEIIFFMRKEEEPKTKTFLSHFKTASIDQTIVDKAGSLYRTWNPSHGIDINDAFLAATVIQTGGVIYTLNQKHFPIPDITVKKPWP